MASEDLVREAQDPSTTAARLAELAQADRALWPAIAVHPQAYPGLLEWLGQQGDPTVTAVLALRSGSSAGASSPTEVIPQQPAAEQATAEQPAVEQPVSPVAEPVVPAQQPEPTQSFEQPTYEQPTYQPTQPTVQAPAYTPQDQGSYGAVPPGGAAPQASDPNGDGSRKNVWLLAGMVAVVILLIGGAAFGATKVFGGDDGDDDKEEATSSQTKDADETPEPEPSDVPSTTPPSLGTDDSDVASGFCGRFKDLQQETLDSMGSASGGSADLEKLSDSLGKLATAYGDLEDEAPSQIKADVAVMADYFDTFKDPSKVDPSDISGKITEFSESAQKVSQYYYANCL